MCRFLVTFILLFHALFREAESSLSVGAGACQFSEALIGSRDGGAFASHEGEVGPIAIDQFEGCVFCASGESRVECEFCGREMIGPIRLTFVNK